MTETWHEALAESAFPEDGKLALQIAGWSVLLTRTDEGYCALNDRCTHQAARLSPGRLRRGAIMCPLHGARFEAATGRCVGGAYPDLRRFDLRVENGMISVLVPDSPPGPNERPAAS